jgi:hypothetical protein
MLPAPPRRDLQVLLKVTACFRTSDSSQACYSDFRERLARSARQAALYAASRSAVKRLFQLRPIVPGVLFNLRRLRAISDSEPEPGQRRGSHERAASSKNRATLPLDSLFKEPRPLFRREVSGVLGDRSVVVNSFVRLPRCRGFWPTEPLAARALRPARSRVDAVAPPLRGPSRFACFAPAVMREARGRLTLTCRVQPHPLLW